MIRAIRAWLASLDPEALRRSRFAEPCSDYDEEFSANPKGPGFHPSDRVQGRGGSRFNPFRNGQAGESNDH